jgi:hypothetical protein
MLFEFHENLDDGERGSLFGRFFAVCEGIL